MLNYVIVNNKNYAVQVDLHEHDADKPATWKVFEVSEVSVGNELHKVKRIVDTNTELPMLVLDAYREYAKSNPELPPFSSLEEIAKRPPYRETLQQKALLGIGVQEVYPQSGQQFLIDCYSDWSKGILKWKAN